jgi:HlyD family secretion protein
MRFFLFILVIFLTACHSNGTAPDASGTFEAQEIIVSAEAAGVLKQFAVSEGAVIAAGQEVGVIDCTQLGLQQDQISASERALELRKTEAGPQNSVIAEQIGLQENQVAVQREQLRVLQKEQGRLQKLVAAQAAPAKQLDDVDGQIAILEKQIASAATQIKVLKQQMQAQEQTAALVNRGILGEKQPLEVRKAQLDDQLRRCKVVNPLKGTVLTKYAEQYEMAAPGKALYKIANLEKMTLRAYITGDQLPQVKIGQQVQIAVAQGTEPSKNYTGTITWIADQAEFTPKSIQTKNERANLVYAVKVETPNDGYLKIGMYGDVTF